MLPTHPGARRWATFHTVGHCTCLACIIQEVVCIIFSVISWKIYDLVSNTLANNLIILPSNHKVFMTLCLIHHQPRYWFFSSSFLSPVLFSRKWNSFLIGIFECPKASTNWVSVASSLYMPFSYSTAHCTSKDICMFSETIIIIIN